MIDFNQSIVSLFCSLFFFINCRIINSRNLIFAFPYGFAIPTFNELDKASEQLNALPYAGSQDRSRTLIGPNVASSMHYFFTQRNCFACLLEMPQPNIGFLLVTKFQNNACYGYAMIRYKSSSEDEMMAREGVTYEQFKDTADRLKAEGIKPTVRKVRYGLGTGKCYLVGPSEALSRRAASCQ